MNNLGIIYGSDTGVTEDITKVLVKTLEVENVEVIEVCDVAEDDFRRFELLLLGLSTWYDGDLQSDWEDYYETFKTIDFSGITVALYGLGDQHGYGEYFVDGIGMLAEVVLANGGTIIGHWKNKGYDFLESKALMNDTTFYGLALDEDNQHELTEQRLETWVQQLRVEFAGM